MTQPTSPDALYLALDEAPDDSITMRALADWYEEQGDLSTAECLHWAVERNRYPFRYHKGSGLAVSAKEWRDGWLWWVVGDPSRGRDWGLAQECRLPVELWKCLPHTFNHVPTVFKEYATRRQAYEALFVAWPRFVGRR